MSPKYLINIRKYLEIPSKKKQSKSINCNKHRKKHKKQSQLTLKKVNISYVSYLMH